MSGNYLDSNSYIFYYPLDSRILISYIADRQAIELK